VTDVIEIVEFERDIAGKVFADDESRGETVADAGLGVPGVRANGFVAGQAVTDVRSDFVLLGV
jgi:hypothetical protein